jgi:hypothetical protein
MRLVTTVRAPIIILMVRLPLCATTDAVGCKFAGGVYSAAYAKFEVRSSKFERNVETDLQVGLEGGGT